MNETVSCTKHTTLTGERNNKRCAKEQQTKGKETEHQKQEEEEDKSDEDKRQVTMSAGRSPEGCSAGAD